MTEAGLHGSTGGLRDRIPLNAWVLALGLLAWATSALLPSLHRGSSLSGLALACLPLGPILLFSGLWLARERKAAAPYVLLCGYPVSLALSASRLDHDTALATFSPWILAFSLLALAGYLSLASALCALPEHARSVDHRPLGEIPPVDLETRKQAIGKLTLAVVAVGALLLVSWGSWATPAHFREMWGRAAPEGATLTALVSGIVGAMAVSLVGPALRAERGPKPVRDQRLQRVAWLLLVSLSGLVVYWLLRGR
ncbi:MAG: hypothetical protein QM778_13710 [Myxococcales bacterium]